MNAKVCYSLNVCLIVNAAFHLSIKFKLSTRCRVYAKTTGKNLAYLKPFLCVFVNSSGVLQGSFFRKEPNFPTTTKTAKSCGPLLLQDNDRKHTTHRTKKTVFLLSATYRIAPAWLRTICIHFVLCSPSWPKIGKFSFIIALPNNL